MKSRLILCSIFTATLPLAAITPQEIIRRVDRQQRAATISFTATMTITRGAQRLEKHFHGYGMDAGSRFFFTFTNPADRGVKYLRLGDSLWIYFPDADDIMRISGHMLRRGMMGSDISYEDLMQFEHLEKNYTVTLAGETVHEGRPCYELLCTALKSSLTYWRQRLLVDKEHFVALRVRLYSRGERLLKEFIRDDIRLLGDRRYPFRITIRDARQRESRTVISYTRLALNVPLPAGTFTRGNLRR